MALCTFDTWQWTTWVGWESCAAHLFFSSSLYPFGSLETAITRLYTHFTDHNTDKPLSISARNIMKLCARFHKSTEAIGVFFSLNMTTAFQNKSIQCFLCLFLHLFYTLPAHFGIQNGRYLHIYTTLCQTNKYTASNRLALFGSLSSLFVADGPCVGFFMCVCVVHPTVLHLWFTTWKRFTSL